MYRLPALTLVALIGSSAAPGRVGAQKGPAPHVAPVDKEPIEKAIDPAREALARIQKFYETTTDLHARFEQELLSGLGVKKKASGELWLKKPGRMRWEYAKPEKKLMVADGQTLWVYEPDDEQAFRQELRSSALPSSVTFLWGSGKLGEEFAVTVEKDSGFGGAGDLVLKLVPKQATAQYRYLLFVVAAPDATAQIAEKLKSSMVKETVVFDQQGGSNHMTFRDPILNKGVSDGKFTFSPPTGTKVIRP